MNRFQVDDLEILSKLALNGNENSREVCVSYWSGVLTALYIAREYARAHVDAPRWAFWKLVFGKISPVPSRAAFLNLLEEYTNDEFFFPGDMIINNDSRIGVFGEYYYKGMADAIEVGIRQAPKVFELVSSKSTEDLRDWLMSKISWARQNLEKYL